MKTVSSVRRSDCLTGKGNTCAGFCEPSLGRSIAALITDAVVGSLIIGFLFLLA